MVAVVLTAPHPNALRQLAGSLPIGHCWVGSGVGIQRDLGRSPLLAQPLEEGATVPDSYSGRYSGVTGNFPSAVREG